MLSITRCTGQDADFRALVAALDEELNERYGAQVTHVKASPGGHPGLDEVETALKAGGYATDPAYADKLVRIATRIRAED